MLSFLPQVLQLGYNIIDDLFETDEEKKEAKAKLIRLQQEGRLAEMEQRLSAILAEAQSQDPWTSRARPSFLYVVYLFILAAIPMGVLFTFNSDAAHAIASGTRAWLGAIPDEVWTLFGVGYLGYTGARSFDKAKLRKK